MAIEDQIQQAARLIRQAQSVVAITGAGISTPSGIPDFRSPESGAWHTADPMLVASIHAFKQNPKHFFDWIHPLARKFFEARPNPAHIALAQLETAGKLKAIITQNIDTLHSQAGSKTVYELHGHLRQVTCIRCYQVQEAQPILENFIETGQVPLCHCGGVLKPNIILFGEQLPMHQFVAAQMALAEADVVIVAGSSLEVAPASDLPLTALENGAKIIIINHQSTYLDSQATVVIQGDVSEILPCLVEQS